MLSTNFFTSALNSSFLTYSANCIKPCVMDSITHLNAPVSVKTLMSSPNALDASPSGPVSPTSDSMRTFSIVFCAMPSWTSRSCQDLSSDLLMSSCFCC